MSSKSTSESGHTIVVKLAFELIGVGLLAVVADMNKTLGNVIVVLMISFLFFWLMTGGITFLQPILAKFQPPSNNATGPRFKA